MALQQDTVSINTGSTTVPINRSHLCHDFPYIDTFTHTIYPSSWPFIFLPYSWILCRPRTDPTMVLKQQNLCFFLPGTLGKKWIYALALETVWHDTKMTCVVMDDGQITTVSRVDIKNAAPRMKRSTKAWEKPPFLVGFTPTIEKRLLDHWYNFFC